MADMTYNGTVLDWTGKGKFKATSGMPGFQLPEHQCRPEEGPVPEGLYYIPLIKGSAAKDDGAGICRLQPAWQVQTIPRGAEAGDDDLANLVDLGIGGGVDFENVDITALRDLDTGIALAAGIGGRPLHAVQSTRENTRRCRLADAARAGKHKRLRDAIGGNRITERLRDSTLADDVVEPLRTPLAGNDLKRHR